MNPIDRHNLKYKNEWDIPESVGISISPLYGNNKSNNEEVINYLNHIDKYIKILKIKCDTYIRNNEVPPIVKQAIDILIRTKHHLMEIETYYDKDKKDNMSRKFNAINKPKEIVKRNKKLIGNIIDRPDLNFKASHRLIIISLRNKDGSFINWENRVKPTIIHELTHTMCNHLMYYESKNHLEDFKFFENLLKEIDKNKIWDYY